MHKQSLLERLNNHDLFHLRYGKGALIVAVPFEDIEESRAEWETVQEARRSKIIEDRKPIKEKIQSLEKSKLGFGKVEEIRAHNAPIEEEILRLRESLCSGGSRVRPYFTHHQLALFYTHNQSQQDNRETRFDKIISVQESETHLEIHLEFGENSQSNNRYHNKIKVADSQKGSWVSGQVRRIVPIEDVTLEVISR